MLEAQGMISAFIAICAITALRRLMEADAEMSPDNAPNSFDAFAAFCDLSSAEVYVTCAVVADACKAICTENVDATTARMKLDYARTYDDKRSAYAQCIVLDGASVDEALLHMLGQASNKARIAMRKCTQCRAHVTMQRDWRQGPDLGAGAWHNVRCKRCAARYDVFVESAKHAVVLN